VRFALLAIERKTTADCGAAGERGGRDGVSGFDRFKGDLEVLGRLSAHQGTIFESFPKAA
jgi:hypothetical protein